MKGAILTEKGEPLVTPKPGTKLADIFVETPTTGNTEIFDFDTEDEEETGPSKEGVRTTPTRKSLQRSSPTLRKALKPTRKEN